MTEAQEPLPEGLRRALAAFDDYLRVEKGASPRTRDGYHRDVKRYLRFLADRGVRTVREVGPADVADALGVRAEQAAAGSTLARYLAAIRHFHRLCLREGDAEANPASLVDGPARGLSLPKALHEQDVARIIDAAAGTDPRGLRDRAMLELLYAAGLRVSELVGVDLDDVDLEAKAVRCVGKGDRERVVPVGRAATRALAVYLRDGRPALVRHARPSAVFVSGRGTRLSRQTAWKIVKRYATVALPGRDVFPHAFRHSFATHLVGRGADIRVVQEALGHARLSTTQVYTLVSREKLKDVYEAAHPRGRRSRGPRAAG